MSAHTFTSRQVDDILNNYLVALAWSSTHDYTDEDGREHIVPLDEADADFAPETIERSRQDIETFLDAATVALAAAAGMTWDDYPHGEEQIGHDIALTRNGHGVGFWDRGDWELGDILANTAHDLGEVWPYVGDDGLIYV